MIKPRKDKLLERTGSHYGAVLVAAKRARQLNSYYRALGEGSPGARRLRAYALAADGFGAHGF